VRPIPIERVAARQLRMNMGFDISHKCAIMSDANSMGISDAQQNGVKPLVARAIGKSCGTLTKGFSILRDGTHGEKSYRGRDRANAQER